MQELDITGAGGVRIFEIPKWGMAQNQLGTTALIVQKCVLRYRGTYVFTKPLHHWKNAAQGQFFIFKFIVFFLLNWLPKIKEPSLLYP